MNRVPGIIMFAVIAALLSLLDACVVEHLHIERDVEPRSMPAATNAWKRL